LFCPICSRSAPAAISIPRGEGGYHERLSTTNLGPVPNERRRGPPLVPAGRAPLHKPPGRETAVPQCSSESFFKTSFAPRRRSTGQTQRPSRASLAEREGGQAASYHGRSPPSRTGTRGVATKRVAEAIPRYETIDGFASAYRPRLSGSWKHTPCPRQPPLLPSCAKDSCFCSRCLAFEVLDRHGPLFFSCPRYSGFGPSLGRLILARRCRCWGGFFSFLVAVPAKAPILPKLSKKCLTIFGAL
jgi:hypothetical protein